MRIVEISLMCEPSFVPLWLTGRKPPGKICRRKAVLTVRRPRQAASLDNFINYINALIDKAGVARRSHSSSRIAVMGVMGGSR
jgi:hypothetical protein